MAQKTMYNGFINSIETTITNSLSDTDTIIYVLNDTVIPNAPNLLTLGTGASAETVLMTNKTGDMLTVTRGFQGTARAWASGSVIARNFTEYDHRAFKENIEDVNTQLAQNASDLNEHKAESVQYVGVLINGFTGNLYYRKDKHNMVYIYITISGLPTTAPETIVATLPSGYRPISSIVIPVNKSNNSPYTPGLDFYIDGSGQIKTTQGNTLSVQGSGAGIGGGITYYGE